MNSFDHTPLIAWGWNTRVASGLADHLQGGLVPGRVLVEHRGSYVVMTPDGERHAAVSGRFQHTATTAEDFPAVGDWVALEHVDDGRGVIHVVGPRHSRFARPARGDIPGAQVVAANVDVAFVVAALDKDFNVPRLERYLALAWSSSAEPVIVLNKADLCADIGERIADVQSVAPGVPVRAISAVGGVGLETVTPLLEPGSTAALLGSSGVGKSTIVNALLGWERQQTREVRADDSRGRHTTSMRELIVLPSGALLIDSPGMRKVGMWEADKGIGAAFSDIDELAVRCRFSDCNHTIEPGCAVLAAINEGSLDAHRLRNRRKLERELEALERRRAAGGRAEQRRVGKRMEKFVRSHMRAKYGEDG